MVRSMKYAAALLAICGVTIAAAGASRAAEFCEIRKTADGFAALRAQPDADSRLVARMRPGDEVMIDRSGGGSKGWTRVYWWKGGRFDDQQVKGLDKANGQGWVNAKLIDECG